jgi:hypothetical protein
VKLNDIVLLLNIWDNKLKCTKTELQSLIGTLSFASKVIRSGRSFLRRMIDNLSQWNKFTSNKLFPVTEHTRADLRWWKSFIVQWNGIGYMLQNNWTDSKLSTDACCNGYGAVLDNQFWFSSTWSSEEEANAKRTDRDSMPYKEFLAIIKAVATFAGGWKGKRLLIETDCEPVYYAVTAGTSSNLQMMNLIRTLLFISATNHFTYPIVHVSGVSNTIADCLSRFDLEQARQLCPTLESSPTPISTIPIHHW